MALLLCTSTSWIVDEGETKLKVLELKWDMISPKNTYTHTPECIKTEVTLTLPLYRDFY